MDDKTKDSSGKAGSSSSSEQNFVLIQKLAEKSPMVAATVLDLEACADVFKKIVTKKAGEEPPKSDAVYIPPVEAHARASTCSAKWDEMSGADRFRLCSQCKLYMYDFTGMTQQEAEAQVFKRENREGNIKFWKRIDKKYLTKDCPIGAKRLRDEKIRTVAVVLFLGTIAVGICWQHKHEDTQMAGMSSSPLAEPAPLVSSSATTETSSPATPEQAAQPQSTAPPPPILPVEVPQKDGMPVTNEGQVIPEGSTYVTRYRRLEFVRGAPRGVENVALADDQKYKPSEW